MKILKSALPKFLLLKILLLLILGNTLSSCSTSRKLPSEIDSTFNSFEGFETGFSGFVLYDPEKKKIVYSHHGDKYFTPASNTKLFTFYTGLKTLGDSVPALKYIIRNDSLIFWGTGDPSFLYQEFNSKKVFDFLKKSDKALYYATPYFEEEHFGPGWAWDDYNWYYSVERAAFPIYGNLATFIFKPEDSVPKVVPAFFQNTLQKDEKSEENRSGVTRKLTENHFVYQHQIGNEKKEQVVPFKYSPELFVKLLSDTLNREVHLIKKIPKYLKTEKVLYSVPADSLYKRMLQVSDNFIAEQLLLMSAQQISDTLKTENAIKFMKENYLKDLPDEPIWVDGSGLSVYNKFTPRSIVKLLEKIKNEVPQKRLFELLPAGGESGTIKNLYKAEKPYIFAKTGTLSNAHMLSGYLKTRKGKILIFSFMNNNYIVPTALIKDGMEKILWDIYLNY